MIGGCNECHTPGFLEKGLEIPESQWLTGSPIGWRGTWGTTYPANLRLSLEMLSAEGFMRLAKSKQSCHPHPTPSLNSMSDADLQAVYRYIKSLKVVGEKAPQFVPPGQEPETTYYLMDPQPASKVAPKAPGSVRRVMDDAYPLD